MTARKQYVLMTLQNDHIGTMVINAEQNATPARSCSKPTINPLTGTRSLADFAPGHRNWQCRTVHILESVGRE